MIAWIWITNTSIQIIMRVNIFTPNFNLIIQWQLKWNGPDLNNIILWFTLPKTGDICSAYVMPIVCKFKLRKVNCTHLFFDVLKLTQKKLKWSLLSLQNTNMNKKLLNSKWMLLLVIFRFQQTKDNLRNKLLYILT